MKKRQRESARAFAFRATLCVALISPLAVLLASGVKAAPSPSPICQYEVTSGVDGIFPGDTDIGIHCDDCDTLVSLPFSFQLYDQTYNAVNVSSNGRLDFVIPNEPSGGVPNCLPAPSNVGRTTLLSSACGKTNAPILV